MLWPIILSLSEPWTAAIQIDDKPHQFKLDSKEAVSVVGEGLAHGRTLQASDKPLKGPGDTPLQVLDTFKANQTYKKYEHFRDIYVIEGQQQPLLSGHAYSVLNLIARLNSLTVETLDFRAEFPHLFSGLGKLQQTHQIKLRSDAQPVSIFTPREIIHPLMGKVKVEINRKLADDVLSPVIEPTNDFQVSLWFQRQAIRPS
ncbi:Pol polyprotein [Plakobranchus ocellatus]|uniref:Pol polyprotein n=1 Tax=Plakobranchus ocellatus TaxID=259542 RepID=A0AAV4AQN2_9GAST|nr:Pol polyprotein [Plakobranchus ocellatus]